MELSQRLDLSALKLDDAPSDPTANTEDASAFAQLTRLIERVTGEDTEALDRETTLDGAGVASLDRIELAVRIEQELGVPIDEETYRRHSTLGELCAYIEGHEDYKGA
ncbi:acyl carrier protein [Corynebacterium sp. NML120713]|uniref:acyl carrier protein n=1 Tax=Corynebacterium sp. NML120713 TaxID=1906332 RepID=UPI0008FAFE0F|nr:acyl carrier protein [Corynebacterium sp. NML120713]OIR42892.1 hypothetical protein BJP06_07740 [Corynebacterium sp. NML120713]